MDKIKNKRENGVKELDDLVLLRDSLKKVEKRYICKEKSYDRKRFENECKKIKGFLYWRKNHGNENFYISMFSM